MNTTEKAVFDYCLAHGIGLAAKFVGKINKPNADGSKWDCYKWDITISRAQDNSSEYGNKRITADLVFPFHCGMAHVSYYPNPYSVPMNQRSIQTVKLNHYGPGKDAWCSPKTPDGASILYSVLNDSTQGESFADWCGNFGYDEDSRKALALYLELQETETRNRKFFTADEWNELRALLQDY